MSSPWRTVTALTMLLLATTSLLAEESGRFPVLWEVARDIGSITYCDGAVLCLAFEHDANGLHGALIAVDGRTGTLKWRFVMGSRREFPRSVVAAPGNALFLRGAGDAALYRINARTGSAEWSHRLHVHDLSWDIPVTSRYCLSGTQYECEVTVLDVRSGKVVSQWRVPEKPLTRIVANGTDSTVFTISGRNCLTRREIVSGKPVWQFREKLPGVVDLAVSGRRPVIASIGSSGVVALDFDSGRTVWRNSSCHGNYRGAGCPSTSQLAYGREFVCVVVEKGKGICALDPQSGKPAWRVAVPGVIHTNLCLSDAVLVFGVQQEGRKGWEAFCVDAEDGSVLARVPVPGKMPLHDCVAVGNGRLYVLTHRLGKEHPMRVRAYSLAGILKDKPQR